MLDEKPRCDVSADCYLAVVMSDPARRRATYKDVVDSPPDKITEVVHGELHLGSRPRLTHSSVAASLLLELGTPFQRGRGGPGGWIILHEPELHLHDDILVPDLAAWRRERLPVIEDVAYTTLAPDWICEILSPSTEKFDRVDKMPIYAAAGVQHAWLIHPVRRTLEVHGLHNGKWLTLGIHRDDQRVHDAPFDALELELAILWQGLAPPPGWDRPSEAAAVYDPAGEYSRYEGY
jgi:Uma2 family endonuclease